MTRSILNPLLSLEKRNGLGLVSMQKEGHGFTQAVELNWNFKIGTPKIGALVKQIMTHMTVSYWHYGIGMMNIAMISIVSFVNLSNWCWILLLLCSDDVWEKKLFPISVLVAANKCVDGTICFLCKPVGGTSFHLCR